MSCQLSPLIRFFVCLFPAKYLASSLFLHCPFTAIYDDTPTAINPDNSRGYHSRIYTGRLQRFLIGSFIRNTKCTLLHIEINHFNFNIVESSSRIYYRTRRSTILFLSLVLWWLGRCRCGSASISATNRQVQ